MSARGAAHPEPLLSAPDRAALDARGYLLIAGAADAKAVETMRAAWTQAMAAQETDQRGNNEGPAGLDEDPAFQPCLEHPQVMAAVAHLLGGDVSFLGFRGREPRRDGGQQGFHVDDSGPVEPDRQRIANVFWILDDMDETNGATRLVPGSHRLNRTPGRDLALPTARHPEAIAVKARAGDVLVFSAHLWHAGSNNHSGARRRVAMAHFGRADVAIRFARDYPSL